MEVKEGEIELKKNEDRMWGFKSEYAMHPYKLVKACKNS
jgi:hypothetical protein